MANWYSISSDKYKSITPEENSLYFLSDTNEIYFGSKSISSIGKIPVLFEGTSIHATETADENMTVNRRNVEILGQTIQNCLDHSSVDKFTLLHGSISDDGYIQIQADGTYRNFAIRSTSAVLKPSTQYTLVIDVAENTLVGDGNAFQFFTTSEHITFFSTSVNANPQVGITKLVAMTKDTFDDLTISFAGFIYSQITSGSVKFRLALIEGDWADKDISWVPFGLNVPKNTKVKMCGKNIFDINGESIGSEYEVTDGFISNKNTYSSVQGVNNAIKIQFDCVPYTDYVLSVNELTGDELAQSFTVQVSNFGIAGSKVDSRMNKVSQRPRFNSREHSKLVLSIFNNVNTWVSAKGIMISSGDGMEYKEYTGSTSIISNDLCSISDTIRDRVYLNEGKGYHEQNVGSVIINGGSSQAIASVDVLGDGRYVKIGIYDILPNIISGLSGSHNLVICDKLAGGVLSGEGQQEQVSIYWHSTRVEVRICVLSSRLTSLDKAGAQAFLQENPLLVFYPIDPITTEIQISDFMSYAGQTNWYTSNKIKPTIKAEFYVDRLISTEDRDAKIDKSISELTENVNELRDLLLSDDEIWTFDRIQYVVQTGRDKNYFSVGDQIKPNWKDGDTVYEDPFDIVQMGKTYELEDGSIINGLMLQQHYANTKSCPFDPQEALYDAEEELPAGTYHFTVAGDTWLSSENGKVIQFTLTQPIPAGGQLVYASTEGYNKEIAGQNICTYASPTSFTAIETVALSEGSEGTDLGKTDGKGNLNHHQRAFRGCGRWKTSMLRQYLNSSKAAGQWWTKQDKWDRASTFINSCAGYLAGFDADFLAIIKPVKVQTARDTVVYDGGTDVTYDMFFPISLEQLNAAPQISGVEGSALDYWKAVAAADTTGNLDSNGRFKQYGTYPDLRVYGLNAKTTARTCWLRSANRGYSYSAWNVYTSGLVYSFNALTGFYCAPACVIG